MRVLPVLRRDQLAIAAPALSYQAGGREEQVVRFDGHQRLQHFLMMSSFIVLALTGLPQKFSDLAVSQWWVSSLGGLETVRTIHRCAGFVMLSDCVYHVSYLLYRIVIQRRLGALEMIPRPKDAVDAYQMVRYFLGLSRERPQFGRFSYLEKFDYWAVFWGIAMMGGSGLVLMFAVRATGLLPGQTIPLAQTVHSDEAVLAAGWILVVHMFNAHLAPWVFPFNPSIFTGQLSRERYAHEHPLEYARLALTRVPPGSQGERKVGHRTDQEATPSPPQSGRLRRAARGLIGRLRSRMLRRGGAERMGG